jgi:SAM-dependent methyltransferase
MKSPSPFLTQADAYDAWYDTPKGRAIFSAELACIQALMPERSGRWLELGVGTGRFAAALDIREGIDPSPAMLAIAQERGIDAGLGQAEKIPGASSRYDGLLLALTLCFIADAAAALNECRRVLKPDGALILAVVPGDSAWGRYYAAKKAAGHPFYAAATFRPLAEIVALAARAGFALAHSVGTLASPPGETPPLPSALQSPGTAEHGFVAVLCRPSETATSTMQAQPETAQRSSCTF